ncbi:uncharacterized protein B0H64DRAFT_382622 [Chaetomium fimeti]|uniref:Secreted protein n=1 Tax=Chaetomium fimeti TaxID=1854472 RepID=A0AAE0HQZ0_9PEZI|nr:hypothetical protein B0H64DRAFT_382622 [Chaetomium fimeti]
MPFVVAAHLLIDFFCAEAILHRVRVQSRGDLTMNRGTSHHSTDTSYSALVISFLISELSRCSGPFPFSSLEVPF